MSPYNSTAATLDEPVHSAYLQDNEPEELTESKLRRAVEKIEQIDRDIAQKTEARRALAKEVYELTEYLKKWCDETRGIAGPMEKPNSTL